jgi:hypothetical protein
MRYPRVLVLLGAAYALAGCGASSSTEVQAKVTQFAHAVANRDTATLCQQVLAPTLVTRLTSAVGLSCQQAMRTFVEDIQDPTLSVGKVKVSGKTASVVVLATARGQDASVTSVELVETKQGWRLTTLASPR